MPDGLATRQWAFTCDDGNLGVIEELGREGGEYTARTAATVDIPRPNKRARCVVGMLRVVAVRDMRTPHHDQGMFHASMWREFIHSGFRVRR
jgi:hypothetical protein